MTRAELLSRMSGSEIREWELYEQIEPFGERRADVRAAMIASVIANANRDPKRKPSPFTIDDFMPFKEADNGDEEPNDEDVAAKAMFLFGAN